MITTNYTVDYHSYSLDFDLMIRAFPSLTLRLMAF